MSEVEDVASVAELPEISEVLLTPEQALDRVAWPQPFELTPYSDEEAAAMWTGAHAASVHQSTLSMLGAKAANMRRLGSLAAPGFVVQRRMFEVLFMHHPYREEIQEILARPVQATPTARDAELVRLVGRARLPGVWLDELMERIAARFGDAPLIVRSSAIGEDSATASFAGQLSSITHVAPVHEAVEEAIVQCWTSRYAHSVRFYEQVSGVSLAGMAVLIQPMLDAALGGVLFTRAPDDPDVMLIEYSVGHPEGIIHGEEDPGVIRVAREGLACVAHTLPPGLAADAFDAAQVEAHALELARRALAMEPTPHDPLDIEWIVDTSGALRAVQLRPITTAERPADTDAVRQQVFSCANMVENYPTPVSPLLYSIARRSYAAYFRTLGQAFGIRPARIEAMEPMLDEIAVAHHGRLYYNLSAIHACLHQAPFGDYLARYFDRFIGAEADHGAAPHGEAGREKTRPAEVARVLAQTTRSFRGVALELEAFEQEVHAFTTRWSRSACAAASTEDLVVEGVRAFLRIRLHRWRPAALSDAMTTIYHGILHDLLARADVPAREEMALLEGLDDLASMQPVHELWALSRQLRADPDAAARVARKDRSILYAHDAHGDALRAYIARWGHRASQELMLSAPRLDERPGRLIATLAHFLEMPDSEAPEVRLARARTRRLEATRAVRASLVESSGVERLTGGAAARVLDALLPRAHEALRCRERARLRQAMLYGTMRRVVLELGGRLATRGLLDQAGDALMLEVEELLLLASGRAQFPALTRAMARERRAAWTAQQAAAPPEQRLSIGWGHYLPAPREVAGAASTSPSPRLEFSGTGSSRGQVRGVARVIGSLDEADRLTAGDILVTRQTDPAWAPLFFVAGGLVLERGGMLSHGAIVAREFGIPAVLGVRDACAILSDGSLVEVDGDAGTVRVCLDDLVVDGSDDVNAVEEE